MATYKKQLKDQNGDNIIPALGTSTVTSTNIDWSTVMPRVVAAGIINVGTVGGNTGKNGYVTIPTQANTNYAVVLTHAIQESSYDRCMPACRDRETGRFQWVVWNNSSSTSGSLALSYIVVKY